MLSSYVVQMENKVLSDLLGKNRVKAHSMTQVLRTLTEGLCQGSSSNFPKTTGHILDAISPTDFFTSIITPFWKSFGCCPHVVFCFCLFFKS